MLSSPTKNSVAVGRFNLISENQADPRAGAGLQQQGPLPGAHLKAGSTALARVSLLVGTILGFAPLLHFACMVAHIELARSSSGFQATVRK